MELFLSCFGGFSLRSRRREVGFSLQKEEDCLVGAFIRAPSLGFGRALQQVLFPFYSPCATGVFCGPCRGVFFIPLRLNTRFFFFFVGLLGSPLAVALFLAQKIFPFLRRFFFPPRGIRRPVRKHWCRGLSPSRLAACRHFSGCKTDTRLFPGFVFPGQSFFFSPRA